MLRTIGAASVLMALAAATASAQTAQKPTFQADGTVLVPAFSLPPSPYLSPEAQDLQKSRARMPGGAPPDNVDIAIIRKGLEAMLAPQVADMRAHYPVNVAEERIPNVPVRVVTPAQGNADPKRVLINLHGGGFAMCADACAMLESVPIAAEGKFKVITVNYRMGPEARHPAALEDIEAVYRDLLKSHKPSQIGIYGCSAGGALSAQSAAWLQTRHLPITGAIGIFSAGGVPFATGDSAFITGFVEGSFAPPNQAGLDTHPMMDRGYLSAVDMRDASVSHALHPEVLAGFPPSLIITGTRSMDMSPAIVTHSALLKANVASHLIVGEGMTHCYIYSPTLPEAVDARHQIVRFFQQNLK